MVASNNRTLYANKQLAIPLSNSTTMFMFWDILIDEQVFFPLQVKRSVIISNEHGIYELPNNLRLKILGNIRKILKCHRVIT